jgi:hypothetical protein
MKLLSITECARPVLFENASREYTYALGGIAFIAKFNTQKAAHRHSGSRINGVARGHSAVPLEVQWALVKRA